MLISDSSGHGDKSGDKSGEKCVNKRFGAISPTLYAVQYTGTDIHNSRFTTRRLMSIYKVYSIGRTWSWPVMSAPACIV